MCFNSISTSSHTVLRRRRWPALESVRRQFVMMFTLALGVLLCSTATRSLADSLPMTDHIYLYNASGDATDVTVAYSYHKQHVYDPYGNVIGVDYKEGHIYDPIDNVIGYITQNDPITVLQNTESGHIFDGGTRWIG